MSFFGDIGSTAISALGSFFGQDRANRQNKDVWRKTQDWSEMMSNTAWQRGVADMKKAGINPMLAFSQGGAGTPSAVIGAPQQDSIGKGVTSALQAAAFARDLKKVDSDIELNRQLARTSQTQAGVNKATIRKVVADAKLSELGAPGAKNQAEFDSSVIGNVTRWINNLGSVLPVIGHGLHLGHSAYSMAKGKKDLTRGYLKQGI